MMLSTIGAWREIIGLLGSRDRAKEVREYYRAFAVNALRREGWFDFLRTPQTVQDIIDHFGYTDYGYVVKFLESFAQDKILIRDNGTYLANGLIGEYPINPPKYFNAGLVQIHTDAAYEIPVAFPSCCSAHCTVRCLNHISSLQVGCPSYYQNVCATCEHPEGGSENSRQ